MEKQIPGYETVNAVIAKSVPTCKTLLVVSLVDGQSKCFISTLHNYYCCPKCGAC